MPLTKKFKLSMQKKIEHHCIELSYILMPQQKNGFFQILNLIYKEGIDSFTKENLIHMSSVFFEFFAVEKNVLNIQICHAK